ncbi:MAG TPA: FHA domain-containing protein [Chloroflexi bacterium]|nr:FHA domain-containing protein [Chloroflexota bacterium]
MKMSRTMRLYYYAVLGAMGGLIGWQASNAIGLSFWSSLYLSEIVVGGLIGLSIGALIGFSEGLNSRNFLQILKSGLFSGGLGLIGGAIGLPIAEGLFLFLGGGILGRTIGWAVFGLLIGAAFAFTSGNEAWKPALGGAIGGLLGGFVLESVRGLFPDPLYGKAIGLTAMGASIGIFIALIVLLLSRAWFEVTSGKMEGSEFILDKFIKQNGPSAFIGSSPLKSDIVLPDPDIDPQHALLKGEDSHFNIKDLSLSGTFINGKKIELAQLRKNQTLRIGNTELVYHERK